MKKTLASLIMCKLVGRQTFVRRWREILAHAIAWPVVANNSCSPWTWGLLFSLPPALWFSIANRYFSKHDNTMCAGLRKKRRRKYQEDQGNFSLMNRRILIAMCS
jgi:hypothetical protein